MTVPDKRDGTVAFVDTFIAGVQYYDKSVLSPPAGIFHVPLVKENDLIYRGLHE